MPQHTKIILTLDPATRARIEDTLAALGPTWGSGNGVSTRFQLPNPCPPTNENGS